MRLGICIMVVVLLAAIVGVSPAGAVNMLYVDGLRYGQGVNFWFNGQSLSNMWAGSFQARLNGTHLPSVYCVDLEDLITLPTSYPVDILTTASLSNGGRAAWIYNHYGQTSDNAEAAAVQLALWEIVYDNGDGLGSGLFRYADANAVAARTSQLLSQSALQASSAGYLRSQGDYGQDMIVPVPEPASLLLVVMGGLSAAPLLRRRKS